MNKLMLVDVDGVVLQWGLTFGSYIKDNYQEIRTNLWNQSKFFWASLIAVAVYGKIGIVMLKFF